MQESTAELPGPERAAAAATHVLPRIKSDLATRGLHVGDPVFIRAFKEEKLLELFVRDRATGRFELFLSYPIVAASGRLGPKLAEGDYQVPEGFYYVPPSAMKPDSRYHLAFNIGFPNTLDRALGRTGSAIMVHGSDVSIGCLAMTDAKIEEIYTLCDAALHGGQAYFRVHLFPFRMTADRMAQISNTDANFAFWQNLQQGYDAFEKSKIPPDVSVLDKRYIFQDGK
ncbi:MAG: murein L,D-transpeptidase family protein [Verrucomicrobiota bacterium]